MANPPASNVIIDETWIAEWITYGLVELDGYLARHAAFDAYLATKATEDDQHLEDAA